MDKQFETIKYADRFAGLLSDLVLFGAKTVGPGAFLPIILH
jgi:hypothetical protein